MSNARLSSAASKYQDRTPRRLSAESGSCMRRAMLASSPSGRTIQPDNTQIVAMDSSSKGSVLRAVAINRSAKGCKVLVTGRSAMMLQPVLGTGA